MSVYFRPELVEQRPIERVAYSCDTAAYGGSPSSPSATLYSVASDGTRTPDATKLSGSASVSGDVVTSPLVINLVAGTNYLLELSFVCGGNTWAPLLQIRGVA